MTEALHRAADGDGGHGAPPFATHVFARGDTLGGHSFDPEIVGATALFAPTALFWGHSSKLSKREAVMLAMSARDAGLQLRERFLVACSPTSPYHGIMPRLGFKRLGNADYYEVSR